MSVSCMLNESLPNTVAGKGLDRNSPLEFNETDFDGCLMFLKSHLRRIGRADDALEEDYPTTLMDEDGEELDTLKNGKSRTGSATEPA
jgi:hypothetical protein